ncbi:MAG: ATP-binding cassette, subfamily bacterial CydC [Micromonosporaceae bacterium]
MFAAFLAALTDLAGVGLLATAAWLIARAAERPPLIALSVAIVAVRTLAIGKGTLRYVERLVGHDAALRVLAKLRTRVYATLSAGGTSLPHGDLLARLVSDVDGVQDALLRCAIPAGVAVLVAVATVGFTAAYLPAAALVLATGMLLAGLVLPVAAYAIAAGAARRTATVRGGYLAASVDVLHGAADLAAFGATGTALARARDESTGLARLTRAAGTAGSAVGAVSVPVPALTAVGVCLLATRAPGLNPVMVAVLSLVALAAVEAVLPLTGAAVRLADLRGSLERVRALLRQGSAPAGSLRVRDGITVDGPVEASVLSGPVDIRLDGVSARYADDRELALDRLDLDLPAGRRVAVVGPSGAGKSTLLGVLAGTVPPAAGTVAVNARTEEPAQRWRIAGGVLADGYVFHATMRENLTLGRPGLPDGQLLDALRTAGLRSAPEDLDRTLGEDGAQVSGGQRQRLLLARALLAPPPVLLLDEPTEGLDPAAADEVLGQALAAVPGHTVVLVTHRLADLSAFDEVLVLADGRVAQRGRHADLLTEPGWYADWARGGDLQTWRSTVT